MSRAFKLFRLQQVDTQLDQHNARLAEIQRILSEDETMRSALLAHEDAEAALRAAQKALRESEELVKQQQAHIEANQTSLYSGKVTNPKELQDLQKEAEVLTKRLHELEDIELNAMAAGEEKQAILAKVNETLEALKAQQAVEQRALHSENRQVSEEVARLEGERGSALSGIAEADLDAYESVRKAKRGVGLAKVENGSCSACGAELSAALIQGARSESELVRCDSCKRILYAG
jgi:predicted  nucleic acid-binding Zn-ribbon protein